MLTDRGIRLVLLPECWPPATSDAAKCTWPSSPLQAPSESSVLRRCCAAAPLLLPPPSALKMLRGLPKDTPGVGGRLESLWCQCCWPCSSTAACAAADALAAAASGCCLPAVVPASLGDRGILLLPLLLAGPARSAANLTWPKSSPSCRKAEGACCLWSALGDGGILLPPLLLCVAPAASANFTCPQSSSSSCMWSKWPCCCSWCACALEVSAWLLPLPLKMLTGCARLTPGVGGRFDSL